MRARPLMLRVGRVLALLLGAASGAMALVACTTLRDGPLSRATSPDDASAADDGAFSEGGLVGASDAASDAKVPEHDPEWAMWPLPPPSPSAGNYAVAGDVVLDEITQLEWMREPLAARTHAEGASACTAATLGGGGFRLPTRIELLSIVDYAPRGDGINLSVFASDPASEEVWSSTPDALDPASRAWFVRFSTGESATDAKAASKALRCVRGPAPPARTSASAPPGHYDVGTDGARDVRTGLEWSRKPASAARVGLSDALLACNNRPGGQWRVPSARELETLVAARASSGPAWDRVAFEDIPVDPPPVFWTLTAVRAGSTSATHLVVDFRPARAVSWLAEDDLAFVRCVRGPR